MCELRDKCLRDNGRLQRGVHHLFVQVNYAYSIAQDSRKYYFHLTMDITYSALLLDPPNLVNGRV